MRARLWKSAVISAVLSATIGAMPGPTVVSARPEPRSVAPRAFEECENFDLVLFWNRVFIDMLIVTNTANSSSQRLGAIVHTAIFDAYNGVEKRYTHVMVEPNAPAGASRRAAVIAAAHRALVRLFPSQESTLDGYYSASLETLWDEEDGGQSRDRGIEWGEQVAYAVLAARDADGFSVSRPNFTGGLATGQWRPTPPANGPMSAQGLAFTNTFVLDSSEQFAPAPARGLLSQTYADDFNEVKAWGRRTGSLRSDEQSALAVFWEGNASVHWNQAANQIACANHQSMSENNRLLAVLNIAMADTAFTVWRAKRTFGADPAAVTWRPVTSIPLADTDGNDNTDAEAGWLPLVTTPSHPEYAAGHPGQNGVAATVLLAHFGDLQTFTLTTAGQLPRKYYSISDARSDGNNARVWGGMHYRSTIEISDAMGAAIADYVNGHAMKRVHGNGH